MTNSIVTKRGDNGKTEIRGKMVDKSSELVEALGNIDELMSVLGIVMKGTNKRIAKKIETINRQLYEIMGMISGYGRKDIGISEWVIDLEKRIYNEEKRKGSVSKFLEVGGELDVWLNWARTVCRRVERRLVKCNKAGQMLDLNVLKYINRLSDYLFVLGRINT